MVENKKDLKIVLKFDMFLQILHVTSIQSFIARRSQSLHMNLKISYGMVVVIILK